MTTPIRSTSLSADLNSFIYGVSRRNFQNALDLTKTGLSLLKSFPAARDAVLEYFAMVFHEAVNISINQSDYDLDTNSNGVLESISMIGPELINLGESWASVIAPWCINLIMTIATDKSNLPNSTLQNTDPVRVLLDITTQNLTLLKSEERAKCIDMMLGCRACSWAVGWVGRAEPALVAPRALALGPDAARAVLAHLANHPPALFHIRAALLQHFDEALKESEQKRDVIPYLLNLASKSDIVLKALTQDIEQTLTEEVMERLTTVCLMNRSAPSWESVGGAGIVNLLVRCDASCLLLLLKFAASRRFCRQLLEYLLQKLEYDSLFPDNNLPLVASAAEDIDVLREKLLTGNQLEQYSIARMLILVCHNIPSIFENLICYLLVYSRNDTTLALLVRIISGTITMHIPNDTPEVSTDTEKYQNYIKTGVDYALREAMIEDSRIKLCFVEENVPDDQKTYLHHYCLNIIQLLRWENSNRVSHLRTRPIGRAVEAILYKIGGALQQRCSLLRERKECTMLSLNEMPTCHALAEVLDRVDMSGTKAPSPSVEVILKVVQATVKYFFRCLHEKDKGKDEPVKLQEQKAIPTLALDLMEKLRGVQTAYRLLRKLCLHSKLSVAVALRDLLETAMFREEAAFSSRSVVNNVVQDKQWSSDELLMHLNHKHGPITQLTQSHTSVFHAGIIGKGVRKQTQDTNFVPPILTTNTEFLMGALMSCMDGNSGVVEGCTSVSLLLVELVSPDVMYNGLPWPDEDFTKQVSIEREIYMRSALEGAGACRGALYRAALARPALSLASALLRCSCAHLMHRLRAMPNRDSKSAEMARERAALHELLASMALGQLLPPPLAHMLELAPHLSSTELVQILRDCLWNYTRDHVPSPALFTCDSTGLHWRDPSTCKPPATYTDTLRLMIQKKISTLGHLYPIMFLNLEKDT